MCHTYDTIQVTGGSTEEEPCEEEGDGLWRRVVAECTADATLPIEMHRADFRSLATNSAGQHAADDWGRPAVACMTQQGFDLIVVDPVDCMGVLRQVGARCVSVTHSHPPPRKASPF